MEIVAIVLLSVALIVVSIILICYSSLYNNLKYICLCQNDQVKLKFEESRYKKEFETYHFGISINGRGVYTIGEAYEALSSPKAVSKRLAPMQEETTDVEDTYKAGDWKDTDWKEK